MILSLPVVLFGVGLVAAYLRDGWIRVAATLGMLAATAWSLALLTEARLGVAWLLGPLLATLLVSRGPSPGRLSFEALTRRAVTLGATALVAIFAATKFPIGENPTLLSGVPWLLAALGAAWLISPLDRRERTQALVLLVCAGSALLTAAAPGGALTAAASGLMSIAPVIGARWPLASRARALAVLALLITAAGITGFALLGTTLPRLGLQDLALSLDGPALPAAALLLVAGGLVAPLRRPWVALLGVLSVLAVAPSLRWAALAAMVATSVDSEGSEERTAWLALLLLTVSSLFSALVAQPWSARAQVVALAGTLVLMAMASRPRMLRSLVLVATSVAILQDTASATGGLMVRFQWVAAAGAVLLVSRSLLAWYQGGSQASRLVEDQLMLGLLLLAVAAHDPLGLGALAVFLLLVDLALVRVQSTDRELLKAGPLRWVAELATSSWPPAVRFAAVTIAVAAVLQTSLPWGLLAAGFLAALKLAPLIRRDARPAQIGNGQTVRAWLAPALSLACGLAPALVLRMLRV